MWVMWNKDIIKKLGGIKMAKVTEDKYELEYRSSENMFFIKVWGFYSPEDAMAFIKDYNNETKTFIPTNTSLVIECSGLKTSKPESKLLLVECIKLYMQLPYKNRIFIKSDSPTANLMIKSAMREGGMVEYKEGIFLDNMSAVIDYIRTH
jgi:hypothetical protein